MRWHRLALLIAAGALGCGGNETSGRARLWTLLDLAPIFADDPQARVGAGAGFPAGLPIGYFLTAGSDDSTPAELAVSSGFVEGRPARYLTTELWANFDEVWTQPLYLAVDADGQLARDPGRARALGVRRRPEESVLQSVLAGVRVPGPRGRVRREPARRPRRHRGGQPDRRFSRARAADGGGRAGDGVPRQRLERADVLRRQRRLGRAGGQALHRPWSRSLPVRRSWRRGRGAAVRVHQRR